MQLQTMDTVREVLKSIACCLVTATLVWCECPNDVLNLAQLCTGNLGIDPSTGPNRFVQLGEVEKARVACREGVFQQSISCLRALTQKCTGNTDREHVLKMMVDPDKTEKSVNYFCRNIDVYEVNAKCIAESLPEQSNCTREVKRNFKTKAMATVNIDVMMTSTCRFYRAAMSCSSKTIRQRCGQEAANIVLTIMRGFEPPKCADEEFVDETYTVEEDTSSCSVFKPIPTLISTIVFIFLSKP